MARPSQCPECGCFEACLAPGAAGCAEAPPPAVAVGDDVRDYNGDVVRVSALRCGDCEMRLPHEHCSIFAQVGPRRWVNVHYLTKEA